MTNISRYIIKWSKHGHSPKETEMAKAKEPEHQITKIDVSRASIGKKKGWVFSVYWDHRPYENFISALYKTKKTATQKSEKYRKTGKFDWYGDAE